jgi:two-component system cell cycle sensor histidine kinase/response regulator CckA
MVGTLRRLLPDSVELVVRPAAEDGLLVRADAAAVQQVLLDLATNARDAMPRGGTLTIDVEPVPSKLGADVVRLTVSDTGDGIAPDLSELVFEPFFTTKRADRAAGLGLSSVYGVVRQHGGRVTLGAASGGGTAVRVELPGVSRPRHHGEGHPTPHPASPRRGGWILVVEDEEGIRRSVQRALERHGWAVQEAADGLEALSLLEEYGAAFDLLIVDVLLPGLDGIALHGAARSLGLEVPFLFTSGYRDREILLTLGSDPRCAFLPKPWSAPELLARVREVLREVGWEGGSRSG